MFSDGVVALTERGAITNAFKNVLPGRCVGSFVIGTEKVFEFIDNNPFVGELTMTCLVVQTVSTKPSLIASVEVHTFTQSCILFCLVLLFKISNFKLLTFRTKTIHEHAFRLLTIKVTHL